MTQMKLATMDGNAISHSSFFLISCPRGPARVMYDSTPSLCELAETSYLRTVRTDIGPGHPRPDGVIHLTVIDQRIVPYVE
jgi:hypothetical protein